MSRDSSGESLESILASIRRSLAEQATSVLEDEPSAPVELLAPLDGSADLEVPPLPASLSQHLAAMPVGRQAPKGISTDAGGVEAPYAGPVLAPGDAATATPPGARTPPLTVVPAPAAPAVPQATAVSAAGDAPTPAIGLEPAPVAAAAAVPKGGQNDPLWFLSQESEPKSGPKSGPTGAAVPPKPILDRAGAPPPPAPEPNPATGAKPALAARPSPLGAVRGPLPPFFGSTAAEVVKVAFVPDPPPPASSPLPPLPFERAADSEAPRSLDALAPAADNGGSMPASTVFGSPPLDAKAGGTSEVAVPQIQALDAMVAELLRPMLRRWLDENMPRLVSAALKAEAELMSRRDLGRDPGRGQARDAKKP